MPPKQRTIIQSHRYEAEAKALFPDVEKFDLLMAARDSALRGAPEKCPPTKKAGIRVLFLDNFAGKQLAVYFSHTEEAVELKSIILVPESPEDDLWAAFEKACDTEQVSDFEE